MKKYILLITVIVLGLASNWIYIRLYKPISVASYQKGAFEVRITKTEELGSDKYYVNIIQIMPITEDKINVIQIIEKPSNKEHVVEAMTISESLEQEIRVCEGKKYFVQEVLIPGKLIDTNATYTTDYKLLKWQHELGNQEDKIEMYVEYEVSQPDRMFFLMGIMVLIGIFLVWVGYFLVRKAFK